MIAEDDSENDGEEFNINRSKRKAKIIDTDSEDEENKKQADSDFPTSDCSDDNSKSDSESQEIRTTRKDRLKGKPIISDDDDIVSVLDSNGQSSKPVRKPKRITRRKSYKGESDSELDSQRQKATETFQLVVPQLKLPEQANEKNKPLETRKSSRYKSKTYRRQNYSESETKSDSESQDNKQSIDTRKSTRLKSKDNRRQKCDISNFESSNDKQPINEKNKPLETRKSARLKSENVSKNTSESDLDCRNNEQSMKTRKSARLKSKNLAKTLNESDSESPLEETKETRRKSNRLKRKYSTKMEIETDSDKENSEDQATYSKRIRKKKSIESDDSDSEANQPENNRHSGRLSNKTLKRMDDSSSSESEHDDMATPTKLKTESCNNTPTGSEVRRSNRKRRKSVTIPDRKSALNDIETTPTKYEEIDYYRWEKSTRRNNLVYCASSYNQERRGDYAGEYISSGDEDFIVDDDVIYGNDDVRKKKKKSRKSRTKVKEKRKVDSDENDSDDGESEIENENEGGKGVNGETSSCKNCKGMNDGKNVLKDVVYSRRATLKERNEKNKPLEKLQKLRKSKGLSLQERENVLEDDEDDFSEGGSEADDAFHHPYEEKSSDREFINDSSYDEETDRKDSVAKDTSKDHISSVADTGGKGGRVVMNESSDEENKMEISLDENEVRFFRAVVANDLSEVENILATHSFMNILNQTKDTALHSATKLKHPQMVKQLLELGAKPNLGNAEHQAPALCYAAINKDPDCFRVLLAVTDLVACNQRIYKHMEGKNLLHLIVEKPVNEDTGGIVDVVKIHQCIEMLQNHDEIRFKKYVQELDDHKSTPLVAAIKTGCFQGVRCLAEVLLGYKEDMSDPFVYNTEEGGNLVHMAVQYSVMGLEEILPFVRDQVNQKDLHGFAPLMYVCELGRYDCFKILLQAGASIYVKEGRDVTPLHLAAACGNLDIIKHLLSVGHPVDCKDEDGWPPLLYANFQTDKQCVVELFQKNPAQLFCLGGLMSEELSEERKEKNAKIIQKTLESISHIDTYYTLFNNFIGRNIGLLDANNLGVFIRAWKRILNFENKVKWLKRKYSTSAWSGVHVRVNREKVLESAMEQLHEKFPINHMDVKFDGEEGMCLGPKREFLSCIVQDSIDPKHMIFASADKKNYSPSPNSYFLRKMKVSLCNNVKCDDFDKRLVGDQLIKEPDLNDSIPDGDLIVAIQIQEFKEMEEKQAKIFRQLRFLGRFVAHVILSSEDIELYLTKSFVQQLLGEKLCHPDVLYHDDSTYFNNIKDNYMDDLFLPFSTIYHDPWSGKPQEISLSNSKNADITEENKDEYLKCLSKFLYQDLIVDEVKAFKSGFNEVVFKHDMKMFTADEFSLLLNGVRTIDIQDWKRNTRYEDWNESDDVIVWFWGLVESLKEDEKSLLLKFVTGTPCVPLGGFRNLGGLGGGTCRFTIAQSYSDCEKLPHASTCFNRIGLPRYKTEEILRDKILIAIRHGSVGFAFY